MATMKRSALVLLIALGAGGAGSAAAQAAPTRGQLLYETHCRACHSTQMHWREKRQVTDWASLVAQVRRWQGETNLNWSAADIDAVAHHLNGAIYRVAVPKVVARTERTGPLGPS